MQAKRRCTQARGELALHMPELSKQSLSSQQIKLRWTDRGLSWEAWGYHGFRPDVISIVNSHWLEFF